MAKILVIYGATPGQTLQQTRQLTRLLRQSGHQPLLRAVEQLPDELSAQAVQGVIIGSKAYWGANRLYNLKQGEGHQGYGAEASHASER